MKPAITFSQSIDGFILNLNARHLSQHTINDYSATFRKFLAFLDHDPPIASITQHEIETFLASQTVSKKTVLNYHTGLSSLWTWATTEGITNEHIVSKVPRPKPEKRIIKPYSQEEIRAMLKAISHTRYYTRPGKKESRHSLHHIERNRAVILVLLDTGMRASELCELHIHHLDLKDQIIRVYGKGDKERIIPICARTAKVLWRYLATRPDDTAGDYLFVNLNEGPLTRDRLLLLSIGGGLLFRDGTRRWLTPHMRRFYDPIVGVSITIFSRAARFWACCDSNSVGQSLNLFWDNTSLRAKIQQVASPHSLQLVWGSSL